MKRALQIIVTQENNYRASYPDVHREIPAKQSLRDFENKNYK